MKENRILVLTLICLNWLTANAQVTTYTLPSNKEQIDNLCQNDAEYAEKVRTEQMKQNHWDLFAKNNLASNEASFTNEDNSNPALVNGINIVFINSAPQAELLLSEVVNEEAA